MRQGPGQGGDDEVTWYLVSPPHTGELGPAWSGVRSQSSLSDKVRGGCQPPLAEAGPCTAVRAHAFAHGLSVRTPTHGHRHPPDLPQTMQIILFTAVSPGLKQCLVHRRC